MGYFPQVLNFLNGEPLALAQTFPISKFTCSTIKKSHMSNIKYKVYMDKTIICQTLTMTIAIQSCNCVWSPRVRVYVRTRLYNKSKLILCNICAQRIQSRMAGPFLVQGIYRLQYKHWPNHSTWSYMPHTQLPICAELSSIVGSQLHIPYVMYSQ